MQDTEDIKRMVTDLANRLRDKFPEGLAAVKFDSSELVGEKVLEFWRGERRRFIALYENKWTEESVILTSEGIFETKLSLVGSSLCPNWEKLIPANNICWALYRKQAIMEMALL